MVGLCWIPVVLSFSGLNLTMAGHLQDLQKGAKIVSADGDLIEVIKAEVQKTTKLVELERLGRRLRCN